MYKLLVVDDHPVVRHGIRHILEGESDFEVQGEAGSAYEAMAMIDQQAPDLVLLDVSLPDVNGIEALRMIHRRHPKLQVLVLSVYEEDLYAVRAMKEGASGYLTKGSASQELVKAVRQVLGGGRYITATLAERLADAVRGNTDQPAHAELSLREFEVMRMIAQGRTLKAISEALHLSPKTITTYRSRILEKMRMSTNEDITQYVMRNRLLE